MKMHRVQISNLDPMLTTKAKEKAEQLGLSLSGYVRSLIVADLDRDTPASRRTHRHDEDDPPNLNTGEPWSAMDIRDLRWGINRRHSVERTADFLCRMRSGWLAVAGPERLRSSNAAHAS
jgi:hypothetical protein